MAARLRRRWSWGASCRASWGGFRGAAALHLVSAWQGGRLVGTGAYTHRGGGGQRAGRGRRLQARSGSPGLCPCMRGGSAQPFDRPRIPTGGDLHVHAGGRCWAAGAKGAGAGAAGCRRPSAELWGSRRLAAAAAGRALRALVRSRPAGRPRDAAAGWQPVARPWQ